MLKTDFKLFNINKRKINAALKSEGSLTAIVTEQDELANLLLHSKKVKEKGKELQDKINNSRERVKEFLSKTD